jgi:hypothetical protein
MIKRSVKSQVRQQFKYGENILKTVAKYFFQSAYAYVPASAVWKSTSTPSILFLIVIDFFYILFKILIQICKFLRCV